MIRDIFVRFVEWCGVTTLPRDAYAVTWLDKDGFSFLIPKSSDTEIVPPNAIALFACVSRLTDDKAFADEVFAWFDRVTSGGNDA